MKKFIFHIAPMLAGLFIAQCLSTLFVYLSNVDFYNSLLAISKAGYFIVPSKTLMENLVHIKPAFMGGFLFTFSIGAGITIFTMSILWFRSHFFLSNKTIAMLMLPSSIAALYFINQKTFLPIASLYFILIPVGITLVHIKTMRYKDPPKSLVTGIIPSIGILILGLLWWTQLTDDMFTNIRDRLLFSNSMGKKVVDFYYTYNLYPIQAIKSLSQKTLRTCDLSNIIDPEVKKEVTHILENYEYLDIGPSSKAEVQIIFANNTLKLKNDDGLSISTSYESFKKRPWYYLNDYSQKRDPYGGFRIITFYSLLLGLPISLFLFFYYLFQILVSYLLKGTLCPWISMGLCVLAGLSMLIPMRNQYAPLDTPQAIEKALNSKDLNLRLHGLKTVHDKKMDIGVFPSFIAMAESSDIAERYWLARSLSFSKRSETRKVLLSLLDDPHPNVLCQTYYSLGIRKDPSVINLILQTFEKRPHWYAQWYGYRTLRMLGWKQKKLN